MLKSKVNQYGIQRYHPASLLIELYPELKDIRIRSVNNAISNEQCLELDMLLFKDSEIKDIGEED